MNIGNFIFGGMQYIFIVFFIFFILMFVLTAGIIIFIIVHGVKQERKNNRSPRITVPAMVVTKRTQVSYHQHRNDQMMNSATTYYYATFQVDSGDRMELSVSGTEYGWLAEGDRGQLTFQGTRFLSFERT